VSASICLLLYGAVLVWLCPALLARITRDGHNPQLSVAVWLSAIAMAAAVWVVAGVGMIVNVTAMHQDPMGFCVDAVLALHHHFGWMGDLSVVAATGLAIAGTVLVGRRLMRTLRRMSQRSREHAYAAHMLGATTPRDGVVIVDADESAVYCVAGRPPAIVVTSGAMAGLDDAQLAAVLAHERAHLRGRHPQLMMLLKALATATPMLLLVRRGADAVGRLLEMSADDTAARTHGRDTLLAGLIALAGQARPAGPALAAGDTAVLARATRLAHPAGVGAQLREMLLLAVTLVAVIVAPAVILVLWHQATIAGVLDV
jgi:Zn-dependent protease with chaperone function